MSDIGRAWLTIDGRFLARVLGLPGIVRIVRADSNGFDFGVRLGLEGEGLPIVPAGQVLPDIYAIVRTEIEGGVERIYVSYSHAPEKQWLAYKRIREHLVTDDPPLGHSALVNQS